MATQYQNIIVYEPSIDRGFAPAPVSLFSYLLNYRHSVTGGPRLLLFGDGPWVVNRGGNTNTVNVLLDNTGGRNQYEGIITGAWGDCIVVGAAERIPGSDACRRVSLAHLLGGNYERLERNFIIQNMDIRFTYAFICAEPGYHTITPGTDRDEVKYSMDTALKNVIKKLVGWGISENKIILYYSAGSGFGISLKSYFGEVESLRPRNITRPGFTLASLFRRRRSDRMATTDTRVI